MTSKKLTRGLVVTVVVIGFLGLGYAAVSDTVTSLIARQAVKRQVSMSVSSKIDRYSNHSTLFTVEELTMFAKKVQFPIAPMLPVMDRSTPLVVYLNQFTDFPSLADAILALNATEKAYSQADLIKVVEDSGRATPEFVAYLRGKYIQQ